MKNMFGSVSGTKSVFLKHGRHFPFVFQLHDASPIIMLDPYLMHENPINLGKVLRTPCKLFTYSAFPKALNNRLELIYDDTAQELTQIKWVNGISAKFSYDLEDIFICNPNPLDEKLLYHPEQDNLSIRIIDDRGEYTIHLIYPLKRMVGMYLSSGIYKMNFYIMAYGKMFSQYSKEFERNLQKIAERLELEPEILLERFKVCIDAYFSNIPSWFSFETNMKFNPSNM